MDLLSTGADIRRRYILLGVGENEIRSAVCEPEAVCEPL